MRFVSMVVVMAAALGVAGSARAGDWRKELSSDIVTVVNGKMKAESFQVCTVNVPGAKKNSLQFRISGEAPADGTISRDFFVSFQAIMSTMLIAGMGQKIGETANMDASKALDCKGISAPIGRVDMEMNFYMTGEGFQMEMVSTADGDVRRESQTWASIFAD